MNVSATKTFKVIQNTLKQCYFLASLYRVKQLEDENMEMSLNLCRLKSQTEKLDEVRLFYWTLSSSYSKLQSFESPASFLLCRVEVPKQTIFFVNSISFLKCQFPPNLNLKHIAVIRNHCIYHVNNFSLQKHTVNEIMHVIVERYSKKQCLMKQRHKRVYFSTLRRSRG